MGYIKWLVSALKEDSVKAGVKYVIFSILIVVLPVLVVSFLSTINGWFILLLIPVLFFLFLGYCIRWMMDGLIMNKRKESE